MRRGGAERLCLGRITRRNSLDIRTVLESTMPPHNGDAGRRVSGMIESCFQPLRGLRLADLLVCPSRGLGAFDPGGSSARILP
jgi:hypothetical protein